MITRHFGSDRVTSEKPMCVVSVGMLKPLVTWIKAMNTRLKRLS